MEAAMLAIRSAWRGMIDKAVKAKDVDVKRAEEIRAYDWFKAKEWQLEIKKFLDKRIKAEIQALSSKNLQYISNTYLPEKIKSKDFLP